jgi:hypothetical protein
MIKQKVGVINYITPTFLKFFSLVTLAVSLRLRQKIEAFGFFINGQYLRLK